MISRLAPSPTGALHLGNARTFVINWALARQNQWRLLMRIEDLDGPRNKPEAAELTLDLLSWLGIDYDGAVLVQSEDLTPYRQAMNTLAASGLVFQCSLSRTEIEAAASPPLMDAKDQIGHEIRFPPELRPRDRSLFKFNREDTNYRLLVNEERLTIHDEFHGEISQSPYDEVGDFVLWTKRRQPSYQLAVVVDDARQGVTDVVRGEDLLSSASRQSLIYRALSLPEPRWWHLPLVIGQDRRKLAKRHGDTRLDTYRAAGVSPRRIIGLLAFWSGIQSDLHEMSPSDFQDGFDLARLDPDPVVFTQEHHTWLLGS